MRRLLWPLALLGALLQGTALAVAPWPAITVYLGPTVQAFPRPAGSGHWGIQLALGAANTICLNTGWSPDGGVPYLPDPDAGVVPDGGLYPYHTIVSLGPDGGCVDGLEVTPGQTLSDGFANGSTEDAREQLWGVTAVLQVQGGATKYEAKP